MPGRRCAIDSCCWMSYCGNRRNHSLTGVALEVVACQDLARLAVMSMELLPISTLSFISSPETVPEILSPSSLELKTSCISWPSGVLELAFHFPAMSAAKAVTVKQRARTAVASWPLPRIPDLGIE